MNTFKTDPTPTASFNTSVIKMLPILKYESTKYDQILSESLKTHLSLRVKERFFDKIISSNFCKREEIEQ